MRVIRFFLAAVLFSMSVFSHAAVVRFDGYYFFQSEDLMTERGIKFDQLARYSNKIQEQIWKVLKKPTLPVSRGYLVIAFRADGQVASWLDMEPAMHEYYAYQIAEAVKKVTPLPIGGGTIVFAVKMSINTAAHTRAEKPAPPEWAAARKKIADPNDIEALVNSVWPE